MSNNGTADKISGRVKEAAGALTDDDELKNEGKIEQATGNLKDVAADAIDKVKDLVSGKDDSGDRG